METKVLRSAIEMYPIIFLILTDDSTFLKPGFHMIAPIARVAPIARNSVQTIQAIIWKQ